MGGDELQDEFDELLALACESQLDETDAARLGELLRTDAQRRRSYLRAMQTCALLERFSERVEELVAEPNTAPAPIEPRTPTRSTLGAMFNYLSQPAHFGVLFACSAMFFFVTLLALLQMPASFTPQAATESAVELAPLARVTAMQNCTWAGGRRPRLETPLNKGELLHLTSGMAEVTFRSGATVLLQGECRFTVNSSLAGGLMLGKISVEVPPRARGYQIVTPSIVVIDRGTQFGVEVDAAGGAELRVFSGQVEVQRDVRMPPLRVGADQSRKWTPQGQLLPQPPRNDEKFLVSLPVEYAQQERLIVQAPHATALAFEAEDFAWLRGRTTGWRLVAQDRPLVSPSGREMLADDSNASRGSALFDDFGDDDPYNVESAAGYRMQFRTAGRYQVYLRYSMFENSPPGASRSGDYHHENSVYLATNFGRRPAYLVHFGPSAVGGRSDGQPYPRSQRRFEGRYYWQAAPVVYQVEEDMLPQILNWQIGDREAGFSLDRVVFSTQAELTDAQLAQIQNSFVQIGSK